jgi:hypothetical protein
MSAESNAGARWAIAGMGAVLAGRKIIGAALFARGLSLIERHWRKEHPEFRGGLRERWDLASQFYARTHTNPVNRWLHIAGIPLIAGGGLGLLIAKPYRTAWAISAGAFGVGWGLNLAGHFLFEHNRPAFEQDPLSFIAGPIWDAQQVFAKKSRATATASSMAGAPTHGKEAAPPAPTTAQAYAKQRAAAGSEAGEEPTTGVHRTVVEA